ncbi:hypothetical protein E2C01_089174 [Portunus trituberculatus]|uniref:Uncharacterized protein n=1 Tax=Portunus trituberculatus TaxID=210409 RepID=A0A5B7JI19_PORTR|nr:hypothetical protein [Portunus trituberculatus]
MDYRGGQERSYFSSAPNGLPSLERRSTSAKSKK